MKSGCIESNSIESYITVWQFQHIVTFLFAQITTPKYRGKFIGVGCVAVVIFAVVTAAAVFAIINVQQGIDLIANYKSHARYFIFCTAKMENYHYITVLNQSECVRVVMVTWADGGDGVAQ